MNYNMLLGQNMKGDPFITDLKCIPMMLISGGSGSGKSVAISQMILSLMHDKTPDLLKFIMIDPKMVEYANFKDSPYMLTNPIGNLNEAYDLIKSLPHEIGRRHEILINMCDKGHNFKNIDQYNEHFIARGQREKIIPRIVIIIDEYADLAGQFKDTDRFLARVSQQGRAMGIHVLLSTQCPRREVVSPILKANTPYRLAFKLWSGIESQIILDEPDAECLNFYGDFLFKDGYGSIHRGQSTYTSNQAVIDIINFQKKKWPDERPVEPNQIFKVTPHTLYTEYPDMDCFVAIKSEEMMKMASHMSWSRSVIEKAKPKLFNRKPKEVVKVEGRDDVKFKKWVDDTIERIETYLITAKSPVRHTRWYANASTFTLVFDKKELLKTGIKLDKMLEDVRSILNEPKCLMRFENNMVLIQISLPMEQRYSNDIFGYLLNQI